MSKEQELQTKIKSLEDDIQNRHRQIVTLTDKINLKQLNEFTYLKKELYLRKYFNSFIRNQIIKSKSNNTTFNQIAKTGDTSFKQIILMSGQKKLLIQFLKKILILNNLIKHSMKYKNLMKANNKNQSSQQNQDEQIVQDQPIQQNQEYKEEQIIQDQKNNEEVEDFIEDYNYFN
ncbi:unnamed protein product [Paramecium pentaurelia]|uniref:Uncharacterized protein n=2 Tax=Paramecium TaxID=5884 RepID=A0A8S1YF97_9CILI|nr:unnamed protein product [Paramecium pentaurelia]